MEDYSGVSDNFGVVSYSSFKIRWGPEGLY